MGTAARAFGRRGRLLNISVPSRKSLLPLIFVMGDEDNYELSHFCY